MRILFTTTPLSGHFHPLVPFAHALRDAGHEVAVASPSALAGAVSQLGLRHVPAGLDRDLADVFPQLRPVSGRLAATEQEVFAGLWPRHMVPDVLATPRPGRPT